MTERGDNQRVDADGVLRLVQKMDYNSVHNYFTVQFFNGMTRRFPVDYIAPNLGRYGCCYPTEADWLEAVHNIEQNALHNWKDFVWQYERIDALNTEKVFY